MRNIANNSGNYTRLDQLIDNPIAFLKWIIGALFSFIAGVFLHRNNNIEKRLTQSENRLDSIEKVTIQIEKEVEIMLRDVGVIGRDIKKIRKFNHGPQVAKEGVLSEAINTIEECRDFLRKIGRDDKKNK